MDNNPNTVTFKFMPKEKVIISDFGINGVVMTSAIQRTTEGYEKMYSIEYVTSQGESKTCWYDEDRLELVKTN